MKIWPVNKLLKKFMRSDSGVVLVLFAFGLIALIGAGGVALDYGAAYRLQARLKDAADSAIISSLSGRSYQRVLLNKELSLTERLFHESLDLQGSKSLNNLNVKVEIKPKPGCVCIGGGVLTITATAETPTYIMHLLGQDKVDLGVISYGEISLSEDAVGAALAIDNSYSLTGAEVNEIAAAANDFASILMSIGHPEMYIGVVPFTGTVNMGRGNDRFTDASDTYEFLGWGGIAGMPFFTPWINCFSAYTGPVPMPVGDGTDRPGAGASNEPLMKKMLDFFVGSAYAAPPVITVMPGASDPGCRMFLNPLTINLDTIYGATGTEWKGCVLARWDPYDANDAPPVAGDRNTLFQKFFFPDEADDTPSATDPSMDFDNDWLPDDYPVEFDTLADGSRVPDYATAVQHTLYYYKYENQTIRTGENWGSGNIIGPNRGCGEEILPLSTQLSDVQTALNRMQPMEGTGTLTSEGIAWAWRVLSPNEPFVGPHGYSDKNKKYIILFTDGENGARPLDVSPILTDYTAYMWSVQWKWLIGKQTDAETMDRDILGRYADQKVLEVSKNFLANPGTEIFVLLYDKNGTLEPKVRPLYEKATGKPQNVLVANNFGDIRSKFLEISTKILVPRLLPETSAVTPPPTP